ncbi:MAG: citramalate synthase [Mycobacteriales bacterium]
MPEDSFHVYDTTLRDGAQGEGMSFSVGDKLAVARLLDELGVGFVEGGWPGALPKDTEFFARARTELSLRHAQLVAFGATRKAGLRAADDPQVLALRDARTPVVCLVAKSDLRHVHQALRTTPEENLAMVADTVGFLVAEGRRVFLDCEHFFDGYAHDRDYGLRVLEAAVTAGADVGVLCDTNGGMLPMGLGRVVREVVERTGFRVGMHAQNDTSCAVANSLAAVEAGATHVQGTANGYGERPGNADLFAVIGNLELKMGRRVLPEGCLPELVRVAHAIAEIANKAPNPQQAYVGVSAFAHKAGLHASAIKVSPDLYNHVDPALVGNDMRILVTEMAGRASVELKGRELGVNVSARPDAVGRVVERVKDLEADGWSFEAADASFELLLRGELGEPVGRHFRLESYRVIVERREDGRVVSEATVKVHAKGERIVATGEGNGPVNALDRALRSALEAYHPELAGLSLMDYKVRILDGRGGTDAVTRVLVETGDGRREWTTVGVHSNVIEASWLALSDAVRYGLLSAGAG